MTDIPEVEEMFQLNMFLYDIDFVDGELFGELTRRSIQKFEKSVKLSCYNNHICYVSDMFSFFKSFCCSTCDTTFSKTGILERHLITWSKRVKHIYPKNVNKLRETFFEILDAFSTPYTEDQKLFKNYSNCVKEETYKETETTKWIRKHVPISVSVSSNLIPKPNFPCSLDPWHLKSSSFCAVEGLVPKSKAQMKLKFIEVETAIKIKISQCLGTTQPKTQPTRTRYWLCQRRVFQRHCGRKEVSTQFLQMQKNQQTDLQDHFERYCNTLPILVLTVQRMISNWSSRICCQFLLTNDKLNKQFSRKANQFVSFKFGDVQLLDLMNFFGGATSLDSFLKARKTEETKVVPLWVVQQSGKIEQQRTTFIWFFL